jgi:hypothetical protein
LVSYILVALATTSCITDGVAKRNRRIATPSNNQVAQRRHYRIRVCICKQDAVLLVKSLLIERDPVIALRYITGYA